MHQVKPTVTVLGLGQRGLDLAQRAAAAELKCHAFDPDLPDIKLPESAIRDQLLSTAVANADVVFLCIPDRLMLLRKVIQRVQAEAQPTSVIIVCQTDMKLDDIQGCVARPETVFALSHSSDLIASDANPPRYLAEASDCLSALGLTT